jgi:hypothetical protein
MSRKFKVWERYREILCTAPGVFLQNTFGSGTKYFGVDKGQQITKNYF